MMDSDRVGTLPQFPQRRSYFANLITSWPRATLSIVVIIVVFSGLWGLGVLSRFNLGGYTDPHSDSAAADRFITQHLGRQNADVVVIYEMPDGESLDALRIRVLEHLASVPSTMLAKPIESYWTTKPLARQAYISLDRRQLLAVVTLRGSDNDRIKAYPRVTSMLTVPGVTTKFSGYSAMTHEYNSQVAHDAIFGEAIATPLSLILLVLIFGGLAAAAIPVACGCLTIFGSLGVLRLMSEFSAVSAFAFNMSTVIGLALAIDYGLFTVSRFREELRAGADVTSAVHRTICTAGRTILFSGFLMTCAFAGMIAIPVPMIQSLALGATGAVAIAALLAVTGVPAALTILGPGINALSWRKDVAQRSEERARKLWGGLADWVIPHAVPVTLLVTTLLLLASAPIFGLRPAAIDASGLPATSPTRAAQVTLQSEFPNASAGADLIIRTADGSAPNPQTVNAIITAARQINGVRIVAHMANGPGFVLLHAVLAPQDFTVDTWNIIRALRAIHLPPDLTMLVGGDNAVIADSNSAVVRSFPLMLGIMISSTLVLMAAAFRSVVLPIKAVLMAALSLTSTFGILTWVVQNGHGASLFGIEPGPLPFPALVLIVAVVFGLSTDYEVFLVSRMVESSRQGSHTPQAVRTGLSQTGRVITAAALLMITVVGATAWSHVALARIAGLGMGIAIFIDAAVVRTLLVPALVTLMGELNWWMPRLLSLRTTASVLAPPVLNAADEH
jgi:uncharacterized membrane protein YdfJ with MMPL/SSD domain